jgi:protein-disulfide isomerase
MSQQRTKKKMAERRAERRRQSQVRIVIGISVVAVALVGIIALITLMPQSAADYAGAAQSIDRSGAFGIAIGDASAPVTMVEYSDFSCSHCEELSKVVNTLITQYVAKKQLRVIYKPVSFIYPPYSEPAAQAAVCAAEQDKGWQMMDHIWGLTSPELYSIEYFAGFSDMLHMDTASFRTCFDAPETLKILEDVNSEATAKGIEGTPTVYIDDNQVTPTLDALTRAIEAKLGG